MAARDLRLNTGIDPTSDWSRWNLLVYVNVTKVLPGKHAIQVWKSDHSCRQTLYAIESPAHDVWTSSVIWNINAFLKSLLLNVLHDFEG